MQAVLMVAGQSTRTAPLTLTRPKPLLPVINRPLIQHSLDQLVDLFETVILITGYRKEMIEATLGGQYRGMRIIYQEQKQQLGTGHAALQAKPHIRDKFVVMNGDDLFARADLQRLIRYDYAALVKRVGNPELYGVFKIDDANRIVSLVEKPQKFIGDLANIGCYVLQPDFFDELERTPVSERGEIEITSAVNSMAQRRDFYALSIEGFWLPTGYAWDLLSHQEFLMRDLQPEQAGQIENGAILKNVVSIGRGTVIKSGAYIEGPVAIGENCVIGPNCYLRACTSIGDNSIIGHSVEIKNSIILPNAHIQHLSYIGDSIIGENCSIGAGTMTANRRFDNDRIKSMIKGALVDTKREKMGAIIADGAQTGIHTVIYPGRKIWPGVHVRPGQVVDRDILLEEGEDERRA
ncbi:NTP transferase domain-containing protein [candidate division KSB1 bacterium]|nr:NTP transferase domain-containing protein [candidate division KSB1 bacterium]